MKTIFKTAGLPTKLNDTVDTVIDTCKECRAWTLPKPTNIPAVKISIRFCQNGEADLLFYKEFVIFHLIDRATRFHAGQESNDSAIGAKSEDVLIELYSTTWVTHHGPFEILYVDGESGLTSPNAKARLERMGTKVQVRAPEQHARYIERRGRALRLCMHKAEDQCKREGLQISFKALLAECVFIGNALTFIGGVSPYQCVYGRTPGLLPDFAMTTDEDNGIQHQRIRTISINSMMETTAIARMGRTLRTTTQAGANEPGGVTYNAGDLVDVWRRPSNKDVSAWKGPYPVVRVDNAAGQVITKMAGQDRPNRIGDVRHTLFIYTMWFLGRGPAGQPANVVLEFIGCLPAGKFETFGTLNSTSGHDVTKTTRDNPDVAMALHQVIQTHFGMDITEVALVRLGHGIAGYPLVQNSHRCCIVWWQMTDPENTVHVIDANSTKVNMKTLDPDWERCGSLQICRVDDCPLNFGEAAAQAVATPETEETEELATDGGRLSTIAEEQSDDLNSSNNTVDMADFEAFVKTYFATEDPEMIRPLYEALQLESDTDETIADDLLNMFFSLI